MTLSSIKFLCVVSLLLPVLAGCGGMVTTAPEMNSFPQGGTLSGTLHGGNQPVIGSTVKLYSVGTSGYGSSGTLYATTTSVAPAGGFSFTKAATNTGVTNANGSTWGCPSTGNPQMYLIASGGSTDGNSSDNNSAAVFAIALGTCSSISASTLVDMNEVTSAATMAALQQYFNPNTEQFGAPSTTQAQLGFANGVNEIPNLVNVQAGTAMTTVSVTATPVGSTSSAAVTITPEYKKLNTIGNILAACVNQATAGGTPCTTLFTNAKPPSPSITSQPGITFSTATDVLQAVYFMFTNPSSASALSNSSTGSAATNIANLFNLQTATSPFQSELATAPTDWTVALAYSSSSACSAGGTFLGSAYDIAVDSSGNVWAAGNSTPGTLMELSSSGTPMVCDLGAAGLAGPKSITIDTNQHVWIADNGSDNVYRYSQSADTYLKWPTLHVPYALTADGNGNVFYSSTSDEVDEFVSASTAASATTALKVGGTSGGPFYMAADTAGNIWVTQTAASGDLYEIYPSTKTTAGNYNNGYQYSIVASTSGSGTTGYLTNPYGLAIGQGGLIALVNGQNTSSSVQDTVSLITPNAGGSVAMTDTAEYAGSLSWPRSLAADGAGNLWTINYNPSSGNYVTAGTTQQYMFSEFSSSGVTISPTGNATGSSPNGGYQKDSTIFASGAPRGIAVDPTGNVWVATNAGSGLVELVGAAVPTITPIAAAIAAGSSTGNGSSKP